MKLITYNDKQGGGTRVGAVVDQRDVFDLGDIAPDMISLLEGGDDALGKAAEVVASGRAAATLADVELLAPIPWPRKLLALAGNYQEHLAECGWDEKEKDLAAPFVFMKPGTTVLPPGGTILQTRMTDQLDHEVELGVVIGKDAKRVSTDEAPAHIAGYTVTNDISSRRILGYPEDRQVNERTKFFDWLIGKWQDTACPMGPWIVTRDELGDGSGLDLKLTVNGDIRQESSTSAMIYNAAEIVSFISQFLTLQPGDVICTGTPHGVGLGSGRYLEPGDKLVATIAGIGDLCNDIGQEA